MTRLSADAPTNEDGTIDHLLCITRDAGVASDGTTSSGPPGAAVPPGMGYECVQASVVPDPEAEVSDHLMLKAMVRRVV